MQKQKVNNLITATFIVSILLVAVSATQLVQTTMGSSLSTNDFGNSMNSRKIIKATDGNNIFIWNDVQTKNIYSQKVTLAEVKAWSPTGGSAYGVLVYTAGTNTTRDVDLVSDMNSGAILTWIAGSSSQGVQLMAQHINNNGGLLWNSTSPVVIATGVKLGTLTQNTNTSYQLVEDGIGGAFISWTDQASNTNQIVHIDGAGTLASNSTGSTNFITSSIGPNPCNGKTTDQCLSLNIVSTGLSITKVPDSFNFPPQFSSRTGVTSSLNNYNGVGDDDRITVQSNGASGFTLQVQASGPFTNGNSAQDIPASNLYVVTTTTPSDQTNGYSTNGVQYTDINGGVYVALNGLPDITAPLNMSDPNNLKTAAKYKPGTGTGAALSSVVNLMNSPKTKKTGRFSQYVSYLLEIPPGQAPGTYQTTITFTALPN